MNVVCSSIRRMCMHSKPLFRTDLTVVRCLSSKDVTVPAAGNVQDYLMINLKSATNTTDILQIIGNHHNIMNGRHLIQALRSLFESKKIGNCSLSSNEIITNPNFIQLCKRLKSQSRGLNLNETIEALKVVKYVGVPADSIIIQVLLQLIRQQVNDLSLHQIVFLDFLMRNFDKNPLVDALRIALPLVFEAQLTLKIDRENATQLAELLEFGVKKRISDSSVNFIVNCLEKLASDINVKTAENIVWTLSSIRQPMSTHQKLLTHCWNILVQNIDQCSYSGIYELLIRMAKKCSLGQTYFYHEDFVDSAVRYIIKKDYGFEDGNWFLRKLIRLGHVNLSLIDYLAEKVIHNPEVIRTCKVACLLSFLSGMANADYKPAGWDMLKEAILTNKALESKDRLAIPWLQLALNFAALDIYSADLLNYVFEENFLKQFLSREYNLIDRLQLLLLYQAAVTLYPSYNGNLPPQSVIEEIIAINGDNVDGFPLQAALERGFGGSSYVWTKLMTKFGHFIDHVVVMRKGGYPVALNQISKNPSSKTYVEDLIVPSDAQIILVLCLPQSAYNINCHRLRSISSVTIRTLEAMGHTVVPISLQLWSSLPEFEKIPYLMQNIKLKCEALDNSEVRIVH